MVATYSVVKRLSFCYGHRLLDYEGKCAHPHGHNAVAEVELRTEELDPVGMVRDFGEVSDHLGRFIEEKLDHRMILRHDDPLLPALQDLEEPVWVLDENPTAENIARLIFEAGRRCGLPVYAVRLWETPEAYAEYRNPEGEPTDRGR